MTREEIDLLVIDLSSRIPGVKCMYEDKYEKCEGIASQLNPTKFAELIYLKTANPNNAGWKRLENTKPYLRLLSSITEDELGEFARLEFENDPVYEIIDINKTNKGFINIRCSLRKGEKGKWAWTFQRRATSLLESWFGIDYLNSHYFDYRGLIKLGLAIKATENTYRK